MSTDSSIAARAAVRRQSAQPASVSEIAAQAASRTFLKSSSQTAPRSSASSVVSVRTKPPSGSGAPPRAPSSAEVVKRPSTPKKHDSHLTWDSVNNSSSSAALAAASLVAKSKPALMVSTSSTSATGHPDNSLASAKQQSSAAPSPTIQPLRSPNFAAQAPTALSADLHLDPLSRSPYNSSPNRSARSSVHSLNSSLKEELKLLSPPKIANGGSISNSNSYSSLSLPMISEDEDTMYMSGTDGQQSSIDEPQDTSRHVYYQLAGSSTAGSLDVDPNESRNKLARKPPPKLDTTMEPASAVEYQANTPVSAEQLEDDQTLPQYPVSPIVENRMPHTHHGPLRGAHGKKFQRMLGLQRLDSSQSVLTTSDTDQQLRFKTTLRKEKNSKKDFDEAKPWKHHNDANIVSEEEKKRYEGVWAANKGDYIDNDEESVVVVDPSQQASLKISGLVVRELWRRSRLSDEVLERIWNLLIDRRRREFFGQKEGISELKDELEFDDGTLTKEEFILGTWLVDQCLYGRKLPSSINSDLWASVETRAGIIVSPKRRKNRRKTGKMLKKVGIV